MRVLFASDHAGFELKQKLVPFVHELGYEVEDLGSRRYEEGDDYPDSISKVAQAVARDPNGIRGIVLGGSGQGEAIVANRFRGVRAAVYYGGNGEIVKLSRTHNNANVLSLGARFLTEEEAKEMVKIWLNTAFSGEARHERRIKKIERYG